MEEGAQDDAALEGEIPIFQVLDVAGDAVLDVGAVAGFAAEAADLSEAGDAGFDESADVIVGHELRELVVVLDEMRARTDSAHVAEEHVPKLRDFVDA